jgi:hypothetical protein
LPPEEKSPRLLRPGGLSAYPAKDKQTGNYKASLNRARLAVGRIEGYINIAALVIDEVRISIHLSLPTPRSQKLAVMKFLSMQPQTHELVIRSDVEH